PLGGEAWQVAGDGDRLHGAGGRAAEVISAPTGASSESQGQRPWTPTEDPDRALKGRNNRTPPPALISPRWGLGGLARPPQGRCPWLPSSAPVGAESTPPVGAESTPPVGAESTARITGRTAGSILPPTSALPASSTTPACGPPSPCRSAARRGCGTCARPRR